MSATSPRRPIQNIPERPTVGRNEWQLRARRVLIGIAGVLTAALAGLAAAFDPLMIAGAAVGIASLTFLVPRLTLVTALLAACFFYDDFFTETFGFWNPGKLVGLLAVASF